ncbi:hypothetical protein IAR50_000216 [Cryptococcus sp. DSM 104548]
MLPPASSKAEAVDRSKTTSSANNVHDGMIDQELNTNHSFIDDEGFMWILPDTAEEAQHTDETVASVANMESQQLLFDETEEEADDEGQEGHEDAMDGDKDLFKSSQLERWDD